MQVRLHWWLQPFSGQLHAFAVSSLLLVMVGRVAHDEADIILVWSVFGEHNDDGRPDQPRLCADERVTLTRMKKRKKKQMKSLTFEQRIWCLR